MGNDIASFTGSVTTTLAKVSACTFSMRGILLIDHLLNLFRVLCTLDKYWVMRSSLASYSPWICPTISWELLHISGLDAEKAIARFSLDRMASYSASLLDAGNPSWITCSSCSPVGDCKRRLTSDPEIREAPSTWRIPYPSLLGSASREGCWGISVMKSAMTYPFMDNLCWYLILYSLNFMTHFSILPDRSGLCKILLSGWFVSTITW